MAQIVIATAPLEAIATVILIDIMRVLSNHYSTVNQRAIAMVNQWLPLQTIATVNQWPRWKPLQRLITLFWLYLTLKTAQTVIIMAN